ncbi:MAG: hypothetical protein U0838_05495 [Chloroflexota bacterium]
MADKATPKGRPAAASKDSVWSDEERAAMQASARERKKAAKLTPEEARAAGVADVLAAIEALPESDRVMAMRVHELVMAAAPGLAPRTFYGMPAYAKNDKVVCFFQGQVKFKARYSTFGFQPAAALDDGEMWPTSFALTGLSPATEQRISDLARRAAG